MQLKFKEIKDKISYLFKRHFFNQIVTGKSKKIFHYFKIILKNKFLDYPRLAMIETGTTCNIQCPTCPTPRSMIGRPPNFMKIGKYKEIIDAIKDYVHVILLYYTNEPLLNPDLIEMIKYADKNNLFTTISTNVMLLNKKKADEILNSGLDEILLCLDGMTKESYEPFRAGAKFETVVENIKYFCNEKRRRGLKKPFIELQFIVTKLNQNQISLVQDFAKKYDIDRLRIKSLAIGKYVYSEPRRSELVEQFLPTLKNAKTRYKKNKAVLDYKSKPAYCNNANNQTVILDNGQLVMCCYDIKGEYVYGDITQLSFKDIWFNTKTIKKREMAKKRECLLCKKCDIH